MEYITEINGLPVQTNYTQENIEGIFTKKMKLSDKDTMIIPGDAGINYYGDSRDDARKNL